MKNPLISILIPCYNSEKHLAQCIESALNQSYNNKEIILVDNISTDNSLKIAKQYPINIYQLERNNNLKSLEGNAGLVRNKLFEISKGDYLQYLDADDFLEIHKLKMQMVDIDFDLNISQFNVISKENYICTYYSNLLLAFINQLRIQTNSFLFRRECLADLKIKNNGYIWNTKPWQDFIILIDLIKNKSKIKFCNYIGSNYRINWSDNQITKNNIEYRQQVLYELTNECRKILKEDYYKELVIWYELLKVFPFLTLKDVVFIISKININHININEDLNLYYLKIKNKFNNYMISKNIINNTNKITDNIYEIY